MDTCASPDCPGPVRSLGWCENHYRQQLRAGNLAAGSRRRARRGASPEERLRRIGWTVMPSGCWHWNGGTKNGYGHLNIGNHSWSPTNRVAYELWVGPVGDLCVLHRCDNPICINPAHLFLGTRSVNSADKVGKDRAPNGERMTHKLTDSQIAEIRARYATGRVRQTTLARDFGVSSGHMSLIVRGLTRKVPTRPVPVRSP